ncbi:MAG: AraC family transcriptional regulator [Clostridia bacterium]|nr:AraC family transcriptional regulator [Clostridia bacterium]
MSPVFYEKRSEEMFIGSICKYPFPLHVHDVTEIVCVTSGTLEMTIAGRPFTVHPGDIAIAFPSIPHSYVRASEDAAGLALIFSPDVIAEFTHQFRRKSLVQPLLPAEEKDPALDQLIAAMQHLGIQDDSPLKLGFLHLFLSYLFTCVRLEDSQKHLQSSLSYQVLHYVSEHFTEPLSLETTAHALGISRIHLSHIFSQQLHINFRQYINSLRIDRACQLLHDPSCTISQITYLCGYGNPRTFHRAFMAQCQMTPSQYRERLSGSAGSV